MTVEQITLKDLRFFRDVEIELAIVDLREEEKIRHQMENDGSWKRYMPIGQQIGRYPELEARYEGLLKGGE
ncbi:MAG: hypothetical protein AABW46_00690 [Nanoarchaeota archaeon]